MALAFLLSASLSGCGSSSEILAQTKQCTVDADCSGNGWCLDGVCQTPYGLALTIDRAPAADGKIHVSSTLSLSATVTGGTPPVEFALVDEKRLQLVAAPYSWQWDVKTADVTEGSHRVIATAKGGSRTYSSQSIEVIVDRVAPPTPTLNPVASSTKETFITLRGTGEEKSSLKVYDGTTLVAQLEVPAGGVWGPTQLSLPDERTYVLTATATDLAGNVSAPSTPPVEVTVDRTPPQIGRTPGGALNVVPAPGTQNVWSRDPITVTFTESIDATTLDSTTVRLAGDASGPIAAKVIPLPVDHPDGRTFQIKPDSLPPVPDRLTLTLLTGIRDLAGNALILPTAPSDAWWWSIPEWQELAPPKVKSADSSLFVTDAVAPDGSVYMAWQMSYGPGSPPEVWKASGGAWTGLGFVSRGAMLKKFGCAMVTDSTDHPIVAYSESNSSSTYQLYVSRYDGTSWQSLGGSLNVSATSAASNPHMVIDSLDHPIVAWTEVVGTVRHIFVKRWNGIDQWEELGGAIRYTVTSDVTAHDLAISASGELSIAYLDGGTALNLARYNGSTWSQPGGPTSATASEVSLTFDGGGVEVVTYAEAGSVKVVRWSGPFTRFQALGLPLSPSGIHPTIRYRSSGAAGQQLAVAFAANGTAPESGPRVMGWNGSAWVSMASSIATTSYSMYQPAGTTFAVNASGVMSYAWGGLDGPWTTRMFFLRFNR